MNDSLGNCLVQLAVSCRNCSSSCGLVATGSCLAGSTDCSLELALDGAVAVSCLLVSQDSLDLGLDVCHFFSFVLGIPNRSSLLASRRLRQQLMTI